MHGIRIYIPADFSFYNEVVYTWHILASSLSIPFTLVDEKSNADVIISGSDDADIFVGSNLFEGIIHKDQFGFRNYFGKEPIYFENGKPDYISTLFYLINCVQEYGSAEVDELGRFRYEASLQRHFGVIDKNLAYSYMLQVCRKVKALNRFVQYEERSVFVLSHDIDSLFGSLKQDGAWAARHFRFDAVAKLLMNAALAKPAWFNIDAILKIESEFEFKSAFFWLVNRGKINARETNADYDIGSIDVKSAVQAVSAIGFENGLHKSISSERFDDEIRKMPVPVQINRNHYLKFALPSHYNEIEGSGIKLDSSLGFAEHYGFRNSFGLPFFPYNLKNRSVHTFLEAPLHIMDGTFRSYMKIPVQHTAERIIGFLENNQSGVVFSILWHNTFFTDYKYGGYLAEYKKILTYLYESKMNCMLYTDLLEKYKQK